MSMLPSTLRLRNTFILVRNPPRPREGPRWYYIANMEGLELNALGLGIYFGLLMLWSAVVAYLIIFGLTSQAQKGGHGGAHQDTGGSHGHGGGHGAHAAVPIAPTRAKPFRGFSPYEGFKSFAQGETVTVEDIVKGLARESGALAMHSAHEALEHMPHRHTSAPAPSADVNAFLSALVAKDRETAFALLRNIEEHGEGGETFLRRALHAVESALSARLKGNVCDPSLIEILGSCDTPVIEKLVEALSTAEGSTGSKLAITRALNALK